MVLAEVLWECEASKHFITLTYGKLFQEQQNFILAGGEDGVVQVYQPPNRQVTELKVSSKVQTSHMKILWSTKSSTI